MNKYLEDVLIAFNAVHSDYCYYNGQGMERPFAAEFYHQWRLLMEKNPILYKDLILHSNVGKKLADQKNDSTRVEFPDIVLHGNINGSNPDSNKLVVEIKMSEFSASDMRKLYDSIQVCTKPFESCLYIIYGVTREQIKKYINNDVDMQGLNAHFYNTYFLTKSDGLFAFESVFESDVPLSNRPSEVVLN